MTEKEVGAAVVIDEELPGPGIVSERDILRSVGAGEDPDAELVRDHMSDSVFIGRARLEPRARRHRDVAAPHPPPRRRRGQRRRRRPLDARHHARLDLRTAPRRPWSRRPKQPGQQGSSAGSRRLQDSFVDVPVRRRSTSRSAWRGGRRPGDVVALQRRRRDDRRRDGLAARQAVGLAIRVAEPEHDRADQEDRADDHVDQALERADAEHQERRRGERRRPGRAGHVDQLGRLGAAATGRPSSVTDVEDRDTKASPKTPIAIPA